MCEGVCMSVKECVNEEGMCVRECVSVRRYICEGVCERESV